MLLLSAAISFVETTRGRRYAEDEATAIALRETLNTLVILTVKSGDPQIALYSRSLGERGTPVDRPELAAGRRARESADAASRHLHALAREDGFVQRIAAEGLSIRRRIDDLAEGRATAGEPTLAQGV